MRKVATGSGTGQVLFGKRITHVDMDLDRKTKLKELRDKIAEGLISSLAHLHTLGFRRQGRSWKRPHERADGNATDLVDFELTVLNSSVRVRMYEMRWVETDRKTAFGRQTGRLEGTHGGLEWKLCAATDLPSMLSEVTHRLERVTLPWFASGGDSSTAVEVYPLEEFLK